MNKRVSIIAVLVLIMIISVTYIIFNIPEKFDTDIQVINRTSKNVNANIGVTVGLENSSTNRNIFSLRKIDSNSKVTKKTSIDSFQGDFGITINIEDAVSSLYYISADMFSYVNIDLEIVNASDGNKVIQGIVTSKNFIGIKKTEQIKPIVIKNDSHEYDY